MVPNDIDNQKYLELAEMIILLGNSKDYTIVEKHKFMILLFFLKTPLFLEKLVRMFNPRKTESLEIRNYEKYNLLYEEDRISILSPRDNLLLSYLLSRDLIKTEFTDKGFSFQLSQPKGIDLFKKLSKQKEFAVLANRAKIVSKIFGKLSFNEIKDIIQNNFKEINL